MISHDDLNDYLVTHLPELRADYEMMLVDWEDELPGPHVVYGNLLNRRLISMLADPIDNGPSLRRIFAVLEDVASDGEPSARYVVGATVCERLSGAGMLQQAREFMGPATRELCRQM